MTTVAFIPIRGGSKSIPYKNIRPLAGRPLVHWTMQAALDCAAIDRLYVASEDPKLREVTAEVRHPKLQVIDRDPATATDDASTESALLDFAQRRDFDTVVLIQATSPMLSSADLTAALAKFHACGADSLLSVVREHRFFWKEDTSGMVSPLNYNPATRPRRQDWTGELVENGAFYITKRSALMSSNCRLSGKTTYFEMSRKTAVELDEPIDWTLTEHLIENNLNHKMRLSDKLKKIHVLICDMDGTLTDSGVYVGPDGERAKKFSTRDGMGFGLWRKAGLAAALMTSETTPIATARAEKLQIKHVFMGMKNKGETIDTFCRDQGFTLDEVAFVGDDVNDLPAFAKAGFTACPADAVDAVKSIADFVCKMEGGNGAVREVIDLILKHKDISVPK